MNVARAWFVSAMTTAALATSTALGDDPATIIGVVRSNDGRVAGAMVRVESVAMGATPDFLGKPRDLGVVARCDASGRFMLPVVGGARRYALTAAAPGCQSRQVSEQVGAGESDVTITLEPLSDPPEHGGRLVHLHVTDALNQPVPDAMAWASRILLASGSRVTGGRYFAELLAVSDGQGRAVLCLDPGLEKDFGTQKISGIEVRVEAPGYARATVQVSEVAPAAFEIHLGTGAGVTGDVVGPKGPVPGAEVELFPQGSAAFPATARLRATADGHGHFVFEHVAPDSKFVLYSQPSAGLASVPRVLATGAEGTTLAAENLELIPGRRLAGRIRREDGQGIAAGHPVVVVHDQAWLEWAGSLGADGSFEMHGPPDGGPYKLVVNVDGQMISPRNLGYVQGSYVSLLGMITRDHADLDVLLCKREQPDWSGGKVRSGPLQGVESLPKR